MNDLFYTTISDDQMMAYIHCKSTYINDDSPITAPMIIQFLKEHKIVFGVDKQSFQSLMSNIPPHDFPIVIAKGKHPENGIDGAIIYEREYSIDIAAYDDWDFRHHMKTSIVNSGDKLAVLSLPTEGVNGMNVHGTVLTAQQGQPVTIQAGENVLYHDEDLSFYATSDGRMIVKDDLIQVENVYVVNETLSMKTGHVDFVGSIIIKGDVPTGYTVKATGDINIHGIVEAATVISGGSIYISEGLSGLHKGILKADENIYIGYINQGIVESGHSIYVENSIVHSHCSAKGRIYCKNGNIIGGSLTVEKSIEAKDIGNRLNTETAIYFNDNQEIATKQKKLEDKKEKLMITLKQLKEIGKGLTGSTSTTKHHAKMRVTLLRQRRSYEKVSTEIKNIDQKLEEIAIHLKNERSYVKARNYLHPNVIISFGKYKRKINKPRRTVHLKLHHRDIVIHTLKD